MVLVEPLQAGNLGSAARAMKNMGLTQLKLVKPCTLENGECQKLAVGAFDLVENATVFEKLAEAVADDSVVIGTTSARGRSQKTRLYTPREMAPIIWDYAASQRVAIVFGSERRGLSEQQLALCQYLVSIPSSPPFPTLNLAQAVLVLAYEISTSEPHSLSPRLQLATEAERRPMFEHMEEVLVQIGFLSKTNPGHLMRSIRRFLGRAEMTERDVQIVRGIMSQMDWYVKQGRNLDPEEIKKP